MRIILVLFIAALAGCTNVVTPPANVQHPVSVYLVDQGRTSSLILPDEAGNGVRWAFGDWNWYALSNTGPLDALSALFIPGTATLGRKDLGKTDASARQKQVHSLEAIYEIKVEHTNVEHLRQRLEGIFQKHSDLKVENRINDMTYVKHPSYYAGWHDSNHEVCKWLEQLGCTIKGSTLLSVWEVRESAPPSH